MRRLKVGIAYFARGSRLGTLSVMTKFQWDTEEDDNWDEIGTEVRSSGRGWHQLVLPSIIALLLFAGGYAIYDRIDNTVDEVTVQTEVEVRSTVELLYERAAAGDVELFGAMMSGRDREWAAAQQSMMAGNGLLDRSAFGLTLAEKVPKVVAVELSPGLDSAEITATTHYRTPFSETVQFNLTIVMRKGDLLWLYAPSWTGNRSEVDEAFITSIESYWGNLLEEREMFYFEVSYWERDAALVTRMIDDMNDGIERLCQANDTLCRTQLPRFEIQFLWEPDLLARNAFDDEALALQRGSEQAGFDAPVSLPTPSLVGLPTDEASYQALLYGYADQIIKPAIEQLVGYECCLHRFYADALADRMMIDAGLKAEVLSAETHTTFFEKGDMQFNRLPGWTDISDPSEQTAETIEKRLVASTVVDFITSRFPIDPANALSLLNEHRQLDDWFYAALGDEAAANLTHDFFGPVTRNQVDVYLMIEFTRYLAEEGNLVKPRSQQNPPTSYPDSIVGLSCLSEHSSSFVRWDATTDQFETVYTIEQAAIVESAADSKTDSFLLTQIPFPGEGVDDDLAEIVWLSAAGAQLVAQGEIYPLGTYFYTRYGPQEVPRFMHRGTETLEFDLAACVDGVCPRIEYEGYPLNSPFDDKQAVTMWPNENKFIVLDGQGETIFEKAAVVSTVQARFWVSESELAYKFDSDETLYVIDLSTGDERPLLESAIFESAVLAERELNPESIRLEYWQNSVDRNELFVNVFAYETGGREEQRFGFIYDLLGQQITLQINDREIISASPNDQLLYVRSVIDGLSERSIFDRHSELEFVLPRTSYRPPVWLGAGEWLLISEFGQPTLLVAPMHKYYEVLNLPDGMSCHHAVKFPE